jgi:dihydropteroate synthase
MNSQVSDVSSAGGAGSPVPGPRAQWSTAGKRTRRDRTRGRAPWTWKLGDQLLERSEPLVVGIVNVTSDSMFEGARSETPEQAIEDGRALVEAGFEMLDVGAVPARSGPPVPEGQEIEALIPAIEGLADLGVPVSADTFVPQVARRALEAGAVAINDTGGGCEEMFDLAAASGCGLVLMHIEGPPRSERPTPRYGDVVEHLRAWFSGRIDAALARGIDMEQIALDPGLDFDMTVEDDLRVLARLDELLDLERPLYISLSRKDFLGAVLAGSWAQRAPASQREWATAGAAAVAVAAGAHILRLHDASALQAVRIAGRIARGGN